MKATITITPQVVYECPACSVCFHSKSYLKRHFRFNCFEAGEQNIEKFKIKFNKPR
jgi:hypothetical protein